MSRLLALLLAVAVILIAPAAALSWQLSHGLQRDLMARAASVRILAGPIGIATGHVARVQVRVRGSAVEGIIIRELAVTLQGVVLDPRQALRGTLVLRRTAGGSAALEVGEADLQRYLAEVKDVRGARVSLDDGVATIDGTVSVLDSSLPVALTARLAIAPDRRAILLRVAALGVAGVPLPPQVGDALAIAVNPIVVAPQDPIPLRFTAVRVERGRVVITGEPVR